MRENSWIDTFLTMMKMSLYYATGISRFIKQSGDTMDILIA